MDVLSPELVLVSPPDVAAAARASMPAPAAAASVPRPVVTRRAVAVFYAVCVLGTLGPLVLASASR